ncbi:recombinase family protein [Actinomyces sp. 565]|uniref:recombinase family protein n=1 Tax=Actinomyces sp. 565 TaxID=2057794 RepID=UPI0013A695DA|nr:recombinase family protein [Actinomyces sp. 565]NDR52726.1 recombinase family protein [Actinomyces sp. 565]
MAVQPNTPSERARPRRAAIYLRISLDPEMEGLAIDRQREDCERIANNRNWEVVSTYADQSISAFNRNTKRPQYEQMVADYKAGLFDALICWDLDRLSRQPKQLEDWVEAAENHDLIVVTVNGEVDLSTDAGRLFARIKLAVARQESEHKASRQSRAQKQRAALGRAPKGVRPLGYAINGSTIESEAEAVRAIFRAFQRGDSLRAIARALSGLQGPDVAAGVPNLPNHTRTRTIERNARREAEGKEPRPVPDDRPWNPSTVLGILRNPRYAGYSVYTDKKTRNQPAGPSRRKAMRNNIVRDDAGEPVKGQWEAIIPPDQWWAVQDMLDESDRVTNRTGSTVRKHLGAGLYRCGQCGRRVITRSIYYSCPDGHMNRSRGAIDDFVRAVVARRLSTPELLALREVPGQGEADSFSQRIAEQRARIERAQNDYDEGIIEAADLARVRGKARTEIDRLEAERLTASTGSVMAPVLGTADPGAAFLSSNIATQRMIIETLMTVTLKKVPQGHKGFNPDSVEIEWRGEDEGA